MICPQCKNGELISTPDQRVEQEYRGHTFTVVCELMLCEECEFELLTDEQSDSLCAKTTEAYLNKFKA